MHYDTIKNIIYDKFQNYNFLEKIKGVSIWIYLFMFIQIIISGYILFDYDISSVKYLPRLVSLLFIFLTVSGLLYWLFFSLWKKKLLILPLSISLMITNILCILNLYFNSYAAKVNRFLNSILVETSIPMKFVHVSMDDSNISWSLAIAFYLGLGLIIYGNWFIKNRNGFENKYEKQVMYLGGGTYLLLFPIIFVFTHFTFVGTNYQYMQGMLQYTNSAVEIYEKQGKKDFFDIKELKWFPNMKTARNYYSHPDFKAKISNAPTKVAFHKQAIDRMDNLIKHNWFDKNKMTYDNMNDFQDWIQVAYNFNFDGIEKQNKRTWFTSINIVLTNTSENDEDLLRHSTFYLKELPNGSVYAMLDFNRTFKDHKMNYIFNLFFVLYHILYLALFAYLLSLHSNKRMKSKKLC
jgi:hypothetical protein